ncbi:VOC family protein [Staphylococcus edaphicus]|uniref:Glyoxalase/bleomycin resistance/extradiol dioxygenase family protein n=1 Tax=Staphylococcus edaphicus TaxID=1955013 RepID=A0A2C6WJJ8_9STAP|nr:VOC family protein [Staphylococcus edaphicus]PHK48559.1 glyoxalase/bleomycin resistance/extradiol dioxygenase family protein [Staphylococcus edaphicus]UQW81437.1 VOC family protein [Staphylococcus edaphicus]
MINRLDEVMIYVYDHDKAIAFWTQHLGFNVADDTEEMNMRVVKLTPEDDAQTAIVLQDKAKVDAMDMGVSTDTPSLIFATTQFDELFHRLKDNQVTVGDIMDLPMGRVFNFADEENNYFAVKEVER